MRDVENQPTPESDPAAVYGPSAAGGFAGLILRYRRTYQIVIWSVVAIAIVGGTVSWLAGWLDVQDAGYWGAFVVNLVGSAAVVVPIPGLFAVCAAAAPELGLNFVLLGVIGAAGSTIGELPVTWLGMEARVSHKNRGTIRVSADGLQDVADSLFSFRCWCWRSSAIGRNVAPLVSAVNSVSGTRSGWPLSAQFSEEPVPACSAGDPRTVLWLRAPPLPVSSRY